MARRLDAWISAAALAVTLVYWLAWSALGPVTNFDAQVYNLARLWVIDGNGLFDNHAYTWNAQLILPWTFDAVHYPALLARFGYALPSFLCLLGIMAILLSWARERGDIADGLRACLGLVAMPMVVMQATTNKNDLVLAFCFLCWIEALRRYARQPGRASVVLAALALTFAAGSKLTGLLYGGLAVAVSLWMLRRRPGHVAWFLGALAAMFVLNGSLEIYVNNLLQFGDWRGDALLYRYNANNDGWRGFLANELRYAASLLDVQLAPAHVLQEIALAKFHACLALLRALGLEGRGLTSLPWRPLTDEDLRRLMTAEIGTDGLATYGILGMLAVTAAPIAVLARRRLDLPAALILGGVAAQLLIAVTLGWHPGIHRYLVTAMCLAWAGTSLLVTSRRHPRAALGLTVLATACAVLVPFTVVRSPANLAIVLGDRDALLPGFSRPLAARADAWKKAGELPVILTASRAPVFHLYDRLAPHLISMPNPSEAALNGLDRIHRRDAYRVVVMRTDLSLPGLTCDETLPGYRVQICTWRPWRGSP